MEYLSIINILNFNDSIKLKEYFSDHKDSYYLTKHGLSSDMENIIRQFIINNTYDIEMFKIIFNHAIFDKFTATFETHYDLFSLICIETVKFDPRVAQMIKIMLDDEKIDVLSYYKYFSTTKRTDIIKLIISHPKHGPSMMKKYDFTELHFAVFNKDIDKINELFENRSVSINQKNKYDESALSCLDWSDKNDINDKIFKLFINNDQFDITSTNFINKTILHDICSIFNENIDADFQCDLVIQLLENPNIEKILNVQTLENEYTAFHYACFGNNFRLVKILINDSRIKCDIKCKFGTAFNTLCRINVIDNCFQYKKNIDDRTIEIAKLLLEDGRINPNYFEQYVEPAIGVACTIGSSKLFELYLKSNKIKIINRENSSCLCTAISYQYVDICKMLLSIEDHDINQFDFYYGPLDEACHTGNLEILEMLLNDPRFSFPTYNDRYFPIRFIEGKTVQILEMLLRKGFNPIHPNNDKNIFYNIYRLSESDESLDEMLQLTILLANDPRIDFTVALKQICTCGLYNILQYLIDTKKISTECLKDYSLLVAVCSFWGDNDNLNHILNILFKYIDLTQMTNKTNIFHKICVNNQLISYYDLLSQHIDHSKMDEIDENGFTPLNKLCDKMVFMFLNNHTSHYFNQYEHIKITIPFIKHIIGYGIDINKVDKNNRSPLKNICCINHKRLPDPVHQEILNLIEYMCNLDGVIIPDCDSEYDEDVNNLLSKYKI